MATKETLPQHQTGKISAERRGVSRQNLATIRGGSETKCGRELQIVTSRN
jgi:hypothetical protein